MSSIYARGGTQIKIKDNPSSDRWSDAPMPNHLGEGVAESEIGRELARLANAHAELEKAIGTLHDRLAAVVCPPSPHPERASAIEQCNSQLGNLLQARALGIDSCCSELHRLIDAIQL